MELENKINKIKKLKTTYSDMKTASKGIQLKMKITSVLIELLPCKIVNIKKKKKYLNTTINKLVFRKQIILFLDTFPC